MFVEEYHKIFVMSELVAMTTNGTIKTITFLKLLGESLFLYMSTFPSKPNL